MKYLVLTIHSVLSRVNLRLGAIVLSRYGHSSAAVPAPRLHGWAMRTAHLDFPGDFRVV